MGKIFKFQVQNRHGHPLHYVNKSLTNISHNQKTNELQEIVHTFPLSNNLQTAGSHDKIQTNFLYIYTKNHVTKKKYVIWNTIQQKVMTEKTYTKSILLYRDPYPYAFDAQQRQTIKQVVKYFGDILCRLVLGCLSSKA